MIRAITSGVEVSVESHFLPAHSSAKDNRFFFIYRVSITNKNDFKIQLLRRHWHVIDSNTEHRQVEGEGVVGERPILNPGASYTYNSNCYIFSEVGKMYGTYLMKDLDNDKEFAVKIPEFLMVSVGKLN